MRKIMKTVGVTMILILVMVMGISVKVMSKNRIQQEELRLYYQEKEKELMCETRQYLEEQGYSNSGITLTKVMDEEKRAYTMTIHHGKIDKMSENERTNLQNCLKEQTVPIAYCTMEYRFLLQ